MGAPWRLTTSSPSCASARSSTTRRSSPTGGWASAARRTSCAKARSARCRFLGCSRSPPRGPALFPTSAGIDRRRFLVSSGAAALALALRVPLSSAAPSGAALTADRRTIYASLVEAVLVDPSMRVDPALAQGSADEFAAAYAQWPADLQRRADRILDAVERSTNRGYSKEPRGKRHDALQELGRPTTPDPQPAERARLDLAQDALALVAVTVGQPDESTPAPITI